MSLKFLGWSGIALWGFAIGAALAAALPPVPAGFVWERLTQINARVLKPTGWVVKHEKNKDAETFTLSARNQSTNAPPVSFALNWVPGVPAKTQMTPSQYANALADAAAKNHRLEERTLGTQGIFRVTTFRYADAPPGRPANMLRYQFLANDRTGSLMIGAFEAPEKDWENAWKIGRIIADSLRLDETR